MDDHKFKASATPLEVYKDDRVHDLYDRIKDLAETISTHNQGRWEDLVSGVIAVFESMAAKGETVSK
jgi:chorismate mutase